MRYVFIIFLCALLLPPVTSIGVSPPSADITFAPYYEGEFEILLRNSRPHPVEVEATVGGSLAEYFTVTTPEIRARGSSLSTISFALPEDIPPGTNTVTITFKESFFDPDEGLFSARTAVIFKARVWKPYPGRYAEIELTPHHVPAGMNTDAELIIRSRGDQPLRGDVQFRVYDANERLVDSEVIGGVEIGADSTWRRFVQIFSEDYEPGRYTVNARYDYGSAVVDKEASLIIGVRDIDILNVTRDVYLDRPVNPFSVEVESLWNEPIEGVEASFQLGSSTGRTPTINLASFSKKSIEGFWTTDTTLLPGEHNALVTVLFRDGEPVTQSFPITVHNTSVDTSSQPREESAARVIEIDINNIMFLLVVVAVVAFLMIYIYRRRTF